MVPRGHGLLPLRPWNGPPYSISQTRSTLPYITDTVRPTLYHTLGPPYPITCNGPCYPISQHGLPYPISWNGPPYPTSQTRFAIPYNMERLALHTVRPTLPYPTKTSYTFFCPIRAICPAHLALLDIMVLMSKQNHPTRGS
jgi:hypothetical protein